MKLRRLLTGLCLASLLTFSASACGGGGSDSTPVSLFSGTYCAVVFAGSAGTPNEANTNWGELTANGIGTMTGLVSENENGVISPASGIGSLPYTVDASRNLVIGAPAAFFGRISADGKVACVTAMADGETPAVIIMGRKQGAYNDGSVTGLYHLASIIYAHAGLGSDLTLWGSVTFDGSGGGAASTTENQDGGVSGPGGTAMPYSVAADGSMQATFVGEPLSGAIIAGGEVIILAGGTAAGSNPTLLVLTKATAGADNSLLNGTYTTVGITAADPAPPEWNSLLFTGTADGVGAFSVPSGQVNDDGVVTAFGSDTGTYAVGANGVFDFFGTTYRGGVAPSGGFAVCAGDTSGGYMQMFFLLR